MIRILVLLSAMIFALIGHAQEITVVDAKSRLPIEYVVIFDQQQATFVQTNSVGKANLAALNNTNSITLQHPSYHSLTLSRDQLSKENYTVSMTEKVFEIEGVVIAASKWEQNLAEIPNEVRSISPTDLAFENPQTAADALAQSGIFVQKSQLGGGSPMIRGFSANSILIVVDGVRMNNAIYRSGNLQNVINIDPNFLAGAEVIFGPGSVIYGSDALGGVMDFHTIDPIVGSDFNVKASALLRYSTANNENTGSISINAGGKKLGIYAGLTRSMFDDLQTGDNRTTSFPDFGKRNQFVQRIGGTDSTIANGDVNIQKFSGYDQWNTLTKIRYQPNNYLNLKYSLHYSTTSNIPRYDRLIEQRNGLPRSAEWFYGPQKWLMNSASLLISKGNSFFDQVRVVLAHQKYTESRNDRAFQSPERRERKESVDVVSANIDFDKNLRDDKHLYFGLEYSFNNVKSTASAFNIETGAVSAISTRYPDGDNKYSSYAAYGSYKWHLSPQFILSSGLRLSHVSLSSEFLNKTFFSFPFDKIDLSNTALNGNAGLVFNNSKGLKLDLLFSTGFRAPNIDDVSKVFDSSPGNLIVPNSSLRPEYAYTLEVGATKNFGSTASIQAVSFYTILDDALVRRDFTFNGQDSILYDGVLSKVQATTNTGRAYIVGATFKLRLAPIDHVLIKSSYTITEGEDKIDNVPLRHVPPAFGRTSFRYSKAKLRLEAYASYSAKREFADLAPSEQDKAYLYTANGSLGWVTVNLKGSYDITRWITLDLGLENLFDKHYRTYSSGISAPGRNVIVAVRSTF